MSRKRKKDAHADHEDMIRDIISRRGSALHFVGVGGVSMYSLARLSRLRGHIVSGSDREDNERLDRLIEEGITVFTEHREENVDGCDLVIYNNAIDENNPELLAADRQNIPKITRAGYMGLVMRDYSRRIGVSGSHGKSTVTAMLSAILSNGGLDPTVLAGSELPSGEPFIDGARNIMLYEACEYKDSFLRFLPTVTVGLNLELDHTDYFKDIDQLKASFVKALGRARDFSVICLDDDNLRSILPQLKTKTVTFGSRDGSDYRYRITSFKSGGFEFMLSKNDNVVGIFELNIPGVFNVSNAVAAAVTGIELGISPDAVRDALLSYRGIPRRLEHIGRRYGREIYYDYAHHPTEIAASLSAICSSVRGEVTVVFKPHTYSRTKAFFNEICDSLSCADYVVITDIYPAREEPIEGISSEILANRIDGAIYCKDSEIIRTVDLHTRGTVILMGAGDFGKIKDQIIKE